MVVRRKWFSVVCGSLLCALAVVALAACGSSGDSGSGAATGATGSSPEKKVRIGFLAIAQANPYVQGTLKGMKEAAAANGGEITQVFDGELNATKQFQQCQDATASGKFDALIILPVDASLASCMEDAIKQGIKVANTDIPLGPDPRSPDPQIEGQTATVIDPPALRGEWTFDLIKKACADAKPCKFALITGVLSDPYSQAVTDVLKAKAKEEGLDFVGVKEGGYLPEPSLKATQDLLQANPDINVIATTSDAMTEGAEEAVKAAGKTDTVRLLGGGASATSYTAVPSGRWYGTWLSLPGDEGRIATELVIRAVRGEDIHKGVSAVAESGLPPVITKENWDEFEKRMPQAQW